MSEPTDFEAIIHAAQNLCAKLIVSCPKGVAAAHQRNGSPIPFALQLTWNRHAHMIAISQDNFENTTTKEALLVQLRKHIKMHRATAIALMCPVWQVEQIVPKEEQEAYKEHIKDLSRPEGLPDYLGEDPRAKEFLMIWGASQFTRKNFMCRIYRAEKAKPMLGPWGEMFETQADRFSERLQQSIIAVS